MLLLVLQITPRHRATMPIECGERMERAAIELPQLIVVKCARLHVACEAGGSSSKRAHTESAQKRLFRDAAATTANVSFGQLHCATLAAEITHTLPPTLQDCILARFFITWLLRWQRQKRAEAAMKLPLHSSAAAATRQPFARPRPGKKCHR